MNFQLIWYRILQLLAKVGLIETPRPPFYSYAAKHRATLMTTDYGGGVTYADALARNRRHT